MQISLILRPQKSHCFDHGYCACLLLGIHRHRRLLSWELLVFLFSFLVFWKCFQTQWAVIFNCRVCFAFDRNVHQCRQIRWSFRFSFWTARTEGQMRQQSKWGVQQHTDKIARRRRLWVQADTVEGKEVNWERRQDASWGLWGKCMLQWGLSK